MSRNVIYVADNTALLSVHDVSPLYEDDVIRLYDTLTELDIADFTLLLTPFLNMKASNRFEKYPMFSEFIQSLGLEISVHGYSHMTKSGNPAEFNRMPLERMKSRIKLAISLLKRSIDSRPCGFIPPKWIAPKNLKDAVSSQGLKYYCIGNRLFPVGTEQEFKTVHYLLSQGDGKLSLTDALIELEVGGAIQLSLHPKDWASQSIISLLRDMKNRLGYRFLGYWNFMQPLIA